VYFESWGDDVLYRCHWKNCEEPCFHSEKDLVQHITARHVSRNLKCPFEGELTESCWADKQLAS